MGRVEEYLAETRLTLQQTALALHLEDNPNIAHAIERLTAAELEEMRQLDSYSQDVLFWATGVWVCAARDRNPTLIPTEQFAKVELNELTYPAAPQRLPAAEREAVLAAIATLPAPSPGSFAVVYHRSPDSLPGTARPYPLFVDSNGPEVETIETLLEKHSPDYRTANARASAYWTRGKLTPEELAQRITETLTRDDGTRAPSPHEWCALHRLTVSDFRTGLYFRQAREIEQLKGALKTEKKRKAHEARVVLPAQLVALYRPQTHSTLYQRATQGELFADVATLSVLRESAELKVAQLATLKSPEVRAMVGVFRAFTITGGEDGRDHFLPAIEIPASGLYAAMSLEAPSDRERRRHFDALTTLSRTTLRVAIKLPSPDGKGYAVQGEETPMFTVRPIWSASADGRRSLTAEEANAIATQWTSNAGAPWEGPLPDTFRLSLPLIMQVVAARLVLSGDVFEKLDAGAKEVRGLREKFAPLDWVLYVLITQTSQPQQGGLCFVDREQLLEDFYGAEEVRKARAKGKLRGPTGYLTQYEKAVAVLEAGGLARRVKKDYPTVKKGELRDVFELIPGTVLRHERDTETLPLLPAETTSSKKRPRAKRAQ